MYETDAELDQLQQLLDASLARSSEHLRSIVAQGDRTMTATEVAAALTGMRTLAVATVTARGEPRISGEDGHFLHARWVFTTSGTSVKAGHLRARPAVSVAHIVGDDLGVFCHGEVEFLPQDHPDWQPIEDLLTAHYGSSPLNWGPEIVYLRVRPAWMVGYVGNRARVLGGSTG